MSILINSIYKDFEVICRGQIGHENEDFNEVMTEKYMVNHWSFELRLIAPQMLRVTMLIKEKIKYYCDSYEGIKSIEQFEKTLIICAG